MLTDEITKANQWTAVSDAVKEMLEGNPGIALGMPPQAVNALIDLITEQVITKGHVQHGAASVRRAIAGVRDALLAKGTDFGADRGTSTRKSVADRRGVGRQAGSAARGAVGQASRGLPRPRRAWVHGSEEPALRQRR